MKKMKVGFENEIIITESGTNKPIYIRDGKLSGPEIIASIKGQYPGLVNKGLVKLELDACQVEIINDGGKGNIAYAIDELSNLFDIVENTAKKLGYGISSCVAPDQNFDTISSGLKPHYENVINKLKTKGVEKSTNIAGLHCNILLENKIDLLSLHQSISCNIYKLLQNHEYSKVGMSEERFKHYVNVVNAMNMDYMPKYDTLGKTLEEFYLKEDGNPIGGFELVKLKKLQDENIYISETRTSDGGTSIEDLSTKMNYIYNFIYE